MGGVSGKHPTRSGRQLSGGFILVGQTESFGAGSKDVYLIKTDVVGDTLWTKTFGGTAVDWAIDVRQTPDGGYVIAGATQSFGAGGEDVYLIRTDSLGDTLWTKTFGGAGMDAGTSLALTDDCGIIVTGYTSSSGFGSYDAYVIKTDENGDL